LSPLVTVARISFQINDLDLLGGSPSRACRAGLLHEGARGHDGASSAPSQAARILLTPAVKLIMAGTRPPTSAITVTTVALAFGSINADRTTDACERHKLGAQHRGADQEPLVAERAGERVSTAT